MLEENLRGSGNILVIEDNEDVVSVLKQMFAEAGYKSQTAGSAKEAFPLIFKAPPNLIILDINLPDLDGFHIAKELRRNMMLRHIPVILLSGRPDFLEKMRTLDVVVDEYITKPFDMKDMLLRVKMVLQRSQANLEASPLTHLPGNHSIVEAIKKRLGTGQPFAVGYADLNNFKAYNDKYGFGNGDKVIRYTASLIVATVQKLSGPNNFVGHVGGDDFIFICDYEKANDVCEQITHDFDKQAPQFYSEEDRTRGSITVEDRRGVISQFPLLSIAIGLVSDEGNKFSNLGQVNHSLTQLKKYAKSFQGSAFVRDRRTLAATLAEFTWGPGSSAGSSQLLENITTAIGAFMPSQLQEILKNRLITVLFQPILDMRTDDVMAHEALVRGPAGTPLEYPDALFQTARTANVVTELDKLCIEQILGAAQDLRPGLKVFVNVFPETFLDEKSLQEILKSRIGRHLVLELAGAHRASDPADLFSTLGHLRSSGAQICIDGSLGLTGNGPAHLLELKPEFIKLDMLTYKNMDSDGQKRSDFMEAVSLARRVGAEIICTKLESRADSYFALKAGVTLGQGYLFARPAPHHISPPVK